MPANYDKYLRSNKWENIKETVLERDNHECQECGREEGLTAHHKTYDNIFHEEKHLEDLITLCDSCHYKKHFPTEGRLFYEDPFWGTMVSLRKDTRHYKMVYTSQDTVEFSSDTFYKYWYIITNNLYFNCNVVISKKPKIHPIETVKKFIKMCGTSKTTMYKFLQECQDKEYIAKVDFLPSPRWVVNPKYTRRGGNLPVCLLKLFQFGQDYIQDNLNEEELEKVKDNLY